MKRKLPHPGTFFLSGVILLLASVYTVQVWFYRVVLGLEYVEKIKLYEYTKHDGVRYRKRKGLRYVFASWKPFAFSNYMDIFDVK